MQLDYATLSFATMLVNALAGAAFLFLWVGQRTEPSLIRFAGALLLTSMGMLLLGLRAEIPLFASVLGGNLGILHGNVLLLDAVRTFYRRSSSMLAYHAAMVIAALGLVAATYWRDDFTARVVIVTLFYAPVAYRVVYELVRSDRYLSQWEFWSGPRLVVAVLYALHTTLLVARAIYQWHVGGTVGTVLFHPGPVYGLMLIDVLVLSVVLPFGFATLISQKSQRQLDRLARVDALTEIAGRRAFMEQATAELARAGRHGEPVALAMLDLDNFKRINDSHGHHCGDKVLRAVARFLKDHLRLSDCVGRVGGEEFALLLPATEPGNAIEIVERLRAGLSQLAIGCSHQTIRITFSAGLAFYPHSADRLEALLQAADRWLYRAKEEGRNRVRCYLSEANGNPDKVSQSRIGDESQRFTTNRLCGTDGTDSHRVGP